MAQLDLEPRWDPRREEGVLGAQRQHKEGIR